MMTGLLQTRAYSKRHYVLVMAFAIVLIGLVYATIVYVQPFKGGNEVPTTIETTNGIEKQSLFARSAPTRLVIPAINLDTTFVPPLGLLPDQTIAVPDSYTQVGWYSGGATPGEIGPAVILGHVDTKDGPAVFYSLGQLTEGDEIQILREDGTTAIFEVTKLQRYPQINFPTLAVYGPTDDATLRLVTCTGTFDKREQTYSHNLVVFATLKLQ
ncbi:MAG: class F sortase [Patescibacteria group bacterium]